MEQGERIFFFKLLIVREGDCVFVLSEEVRVKDGGVSQHHRYLLVKGIPTVILSKVRLQQRE